jgi:hypothetical protein
MPLRACGCDVSAFMTVIFQADGADRAGGPVRAPFQGRGLKRWKRPRNTTHTKIRCVGEQAMAPQGMAPPAEAPLQHQSNHRCGEGRPRPSPRINVRLEKAHCMQMLPFPACEIIDVVHA